MCKYLRITAVLLTLMITTGCASQRPLSASEADIYRQLHKKFSRMESYSATVHATVYSNKTENQYVMTQQVKEPDTALVTLSEPASLAGMKTLFAGEKVSLSAFSDEESLILPVQDTIGDLFVNHFFSLYYQSEETAIQVSAPTGQSGTILLETVCVPAESDRYRMTLLCDVKTLEPKVMTVYDMGGNIRKIAEFSNFCYNPSFDSSVFMIQ